MTIVYHELTEPVENKSLLESHQLVMSTTFIIADNQDITYEGLRCYIHQMFSDCHIVNVANKSELIITLKQNGNVVVVVDYALFDFNGLDDFLIIEKRFSKACWILFSNDLSENLIHRLSSENSVSMVLKENSGEEIRSALKCASGGDRFLCHQITDSLLLGYIKRDTDSVLTNTEKEILKLIAHGKSVKEIADIRVSSVHTIITHKKNIFRKLEVNNVYEATKYAFRTGLVEVAEYYI